MGSHFFCTAFEDMEGETLSMDGLIHLTLRENGSVDSLHISMSPMQVKELGKSLRRILETIDVRTVHHYGQSLGNLSMSIVDSAAEKELSTVLGAGENVVSMAEWPVA